MVADPNQHADSRRNEATDEAERASLIYADCSEGPWVWLKKAAKGLKKSVLTLYYASLDPRCPLSAKILAGITLAYALSPIDLVPDFIPILGILDDLILLPLFIWLAIKCIPPEVWKEAQMRAAEQPLRLSASVPGAAAVCLIYVVLAVFTVNWVVEHYGSRSWQARCVQVNVVTGLIVAMMLFVYLTHEVHKHQKQPLAGHACELEEIALEGECDSLIHASAD